MPRFKTLTEIGWLPSAAGVSWPSMAESARMKRLRWLPSSPVGVALGAGRQLQSGAKGAGFAFRGPAHLGHEGSRPVQGLVVRSVEGDGSSFGQFFLSFELQSGAADIHQIAGPF